MLKCKRGQVSACHTGLLEKFPLFLGKLLSRSMKLAYALLNKVGSHKEGTSIMTGDRVSLFDLHLNK